MALFSKGMNAPLWSKAERPISIKPCKTGKFGSVVWINCLRHAHTTAYCTSAHWGTLFFIQYIQIRSSPLPPHPFLLHVVKVCLCLRKRVTDFSMNSNWVNSETKIWPYVTHKTDTYNLLVSKEYGEAQIYSSIQGTKLWAHICSHSYMWT